MGQTWATRHHLIDNRHMLQSCRLNFPGQSVLKEARMSARLLFALSFLGSLCVVGCGGGGGSTPTVSPTTPSVGFPCPPPSVQTSQTSQCTATVSGTGSYSSAITWSVSPASIGVVSAAGVFTPAGTGTATITATSTQDSTKSDSVSVTITVIPITITSV